MAAGRQIEGQMNALDFMKRERRRPCDYTFFRYIGQRVCIYIYPEWINGTVVGLDKYYTEIRPDGGGGTIVGTPYNTTTEERWRKLERDKQREDCRRLKE